MNIEVNKHLFAVCCGLIATGYSLDENNENNIKQLTDKIVSVKYPKEVYEFFPLAKTNQCEVNPYWPRGSVISSACFFIEKPISVLIEFLRSCGLKECDDSEIINWVKNLPSVLKLIEDIEDFPELFQRYQSIAYSKYSGIQQKIDSTIKLLNEYGFPGDVKIIFAPILLWSVDYAFVDERLYVIANDYFETAALHEYLHPIIGKLRPQLERLIEFYGIERFVNPFEMIKIGYMTDFSLDSKCHALEDCIIRGIVGVMATSVSLKDYCAMNTEMGFLIVPQIIQYSEKVKPTKDNLVEFIIGALSSNNNL